jgi:Sec-independent protein translocase protein TatA
MKNLAGYWPLIIILVIAAVLFFVGKKNGFTLNK